MSGTELRFTVLGARCRHCRALIEVKVPESLPPQSQVDEAIRQGEANHTCAEKTAAKAAERSEATG